MDANWELSIMTNSQGLALAILGSVLILHARFSFAAETIMLTCKDKKKKIVGELVSADGDKIVIKDTDGNNVDVKWADVQKVSNGLTQEKALARWKEENADKVCGTCHGDRVVACPKCGGTGKDATKKVACKTCNATGSIKCTGKGCVNGTADCPNTCLKLSEGKWELGADGIRWRKFVAGNTVASWSERHLGQVIVIENGTPVNKGVCPQCNGTMKIKCLLCIGTGNITCPDCKGEKQVSSACDQCKDGKIPCAACKGTGLK